MHFYYCSQLNNWPNLYTNSILEAYHKKVCLIEVMFHQLFVCLKFSSHSRIFRSYGDGTIVGEGLHILTYVRLLRPFFSVPNLWWQGHQYMMGRDTHTRTSNLPLARRRSNRLRHRRGRFIYWIYIQLACKY